MMKTKLLDLLKERNEIYLMELPRLLPEIKGDYSIYMTVKEGFNPNILWKSNVSQEFIKLLNELLIKDEVISWQPVPLFEGILDNIPFIANVPYVEKKQYHTKTECWSYIKLKLNQ
ncbi:MAG: hypothetical protein ABFS35_21485 [Bacteroidota bacterium]